MKKFFFCKECRGIRKAEPKASLSDCIDRSIFYKSCVPGKECYYKKDFMQKLDSWCARYFDTPEKCVGALSYFCKFDIKELEELHLMGDGPSVFKIIEQDPDYDQRGRVEFALFELIDITREYETSIREIYDMTQLSLLDTGILFKSS